tara:strand:- start:186 stop:383 length:198 start_codon:yes stop_codon:yes gene_type:complete
MDKIVEQINVKLALISRLEDEKTLGIIKNIAKGFKIPPVRKIKELNCKISINKKIKDALFDRIFF